MVHSKPQGTNHNSHPTADNCGRMHYTNTLIMAKFKKDAGGGLEARLLLGVALCIISSVYQLYKWSNATTDKGGLYISQLDLNGLP